jgi:uroporphyrinogen-III synthase
MKYPKNRSRYLRKNLTYGEKILWKLLRKKNLKGLRFRRQHPIDNYIVDFCCNEKSLVIEIDGPLHDDELRKLKDSLRQTHLESKGNKVLRVKDSELSGDLDIILERTIEFVN